MICYICDTNDWHERKDLNPISTIGICKKCGNIAHKIEKEEEKEMLNYYKHNYKPMVNYNNIVTTTNKLQMIKLFIRDLVKDKKEMICGDVGAAIGYLPAFFRQMGHKATGSEYCLSMRRFSEHFYGIPLSEELETKHKYDFISFYHTLEHMVCPDEKLMKHKDLLKDDGILFISVPEWMRILHDIAQMGEFNVDTYFHKNHLNCFTRTSFNNLLKKCGLETIKIDYLSYGITVAVKKSVEKKEFIYENWEEVNKKIDVFVKAIKLFKENKLEEAIDVYPEFPGAWLKFIFDNCKKDKDKQKYEFDKMKIHLENELEYKLGIASWHYQYQEYEEALKYYDMILTIKPLSEYFIYKAWCLERLGYYKEALVNFNHAIMINPMKWAEIINWMGATTNKLPTWDERAEIEIKNKLFEQAQPKIDLGNLIEKEKEHGKV